MTTKNLIVTITGQSCAGKSTLEKLMIEKLGFERIISTTTRPMREGEVSGESYYFVTEEQFSYQEAQGAFVEAVEFNGFSYAASKAEFERVFESGKPVVIVVEPNGQKQIAEVAKREGWNLYPAFIANPPSVITERFLRRFVEDLKKTNNADTDKSIMTYSSRLHAMMTTEIGWAIEAAGTEGLYRLRAWEFNEGNMYEVLEAIKVHAVEGFETEVAEVI